MSKVVSYEVNKNDSDTQYDWNEEFWLTLVMDNGMKFIRRDPFCFKSNAENCGQEKIGYSEYEIMINNFYGVAYVPDSLREAFNNQYKIGYVA